MKSAMVACSVVAFALCFAVSAWGADAAPAATPAVQGDKAPAAPVKNIAKDRAIEDVNAQVAIAEKIMKTYDEEMAKPEDKRDAKKALSLKLNAALAYFRAAQKAKVFSPRVKDDEKQAFLDQYDKPNREKAISLLLELADVAKDKKAYQDALSLYKQVLSIDPKNASAEAGIKAITEEMKTAKANGSNNAGGSTDKTDIKPYEQTYKKDYTGTHIDWGRTGRGAY